MNRTARHPALPHMRRSAGACWRQFTSALLVLAAGIAVVPGAAEAQMQAQRRSAVLLEAGDIELRTDLRWLIDRGVLSGLSTSHWPMPLAILQRSLALRSTEGLSAGDLDALRRVEAAVSRQVGAQVGLRVQTNTGRVPLTDFSEESRARTTISLHGQYSSGQMAGRLQVNALEGTLTPTQDRVNFSGSYAAYNYYDHIIYAGKLAHFWGPGNDASLVWSNAATSIPGIGFRRASEKRSIHPFLEWMGPWGYEFFIGQLQNYAVIPDARVVAMRMYIRPMGGLELGASRFVQWGGKGVGNGPGALWNALIANANNPLSDPNNELAGFDARFTGLVYGNPVTLYGQAVGEDEAGYFPAKWLGLIGAEYKHELAGHRLQWHIEGADTTANRWFGLGSTPLPGVAYNHFQYTSGLYHDLMPIGHFIGGDGRVLSLGLKVTPNSPGLIRRYSARVMTGRVNSTNRPINGVFPANAKISGLELSVTWRYRPVEIRSGFAIRHNSVSGNDRAAFISAQFPLTLF